MPSGSFHRSYPHHRSSRSNSFTAPLFTHDPFASFFTDPFTLFNSQMNSLFRASPYSNLGRMQAQIEDFMANIEIDPDQDPFGEGHIPRFTPRTRMSTFPAADISPNENGSGRWVSDSFMSTTVNGVTQTIHKQRDSDVSIKHLNPTLLIIFYGSG